MSSALAAERTFEVKAQSRPVEARVATAINTSQRWWWCAFAITLTGGVLRLATMNAHSLWLDEACTALLYDASYLDILLGRAIDFGSPPLAFLLGKTWALAFGHSEVGLRSLPALLGTLTLPIVALLGRRLLTPTAGLWGAGLLAVSPQALELSHEVRTYALLAFLVVSGSWIFVEWVERRGWLLAAGYAACMTLACFTHYYAFTIVAAHGLTLVLAPVLRRHFLAWLGVMAACACAYAIWLPAFYAQVTTPGNVGRLLDRWHFQFMATPLTFAAGRSLAWRDEPRWMLALALAAAVAAFWLPAVWGFRQARAAKTARTLLACWTLTPILLPLAVAMLFTPIYHSRYAAVGLPAFLLLLGHGLAQTRVGVRVAALAIIASMTAISVWRYATEPIRDDWRSAVPEVLARLDAGEIVLFDPDYQAQPFRFYAQRASAVPAVMIGLIPAENQPLAGVVRQDGLLVDGMPRDQTPQIGSASGVWLVQCTPLETIERMDQSLGEIGFSRVWSMRRQRIVVHHYRARHGAALMEELE